MQLQLRVSPGGISRPRRYSDSSVSPALKILAPSGEPAAAQPVPGATVQEATGAAEPVAVPLAQLAARVRSSQLAADSAAAAEVPVVISADRNVRYESVVRVMDTLQRAGVRRVGLSVKQAG
jgi:biopolymer transport protein ExbD